MNDTSRKLEIIEIPLPCDQLFDYLQSQHGLILVQSELNDLIDIVKKTQPRDLGWNYINDSLPKRGKKVLWQTTGVDFMIGYLNAEENKVLRTGGSSFEWLSDFDAWRLLPEAAEVK